MLIKVDLESDLFSQIEELIKQRKYDDLYQFVKIAIKNQLLEEKSTTKPEIEEKEISSVNLSLHNLLEKKTMDIAKLLSDVPLEDSEIPIVPNSLIWSFYTRFFPVKVIVRKLITMLSPNKKWLELSEAQEEVFSYAEEISDTLKTYEDERDLPRNKKLSTGLPTPRTELKGLRGGKKKKKESKLIAGKIRFQEQFLGRAVRKGDTFNFIGACFEMGLIRVKFEGDECLITLSDKGSEFALMENPILDNEYYYSQFSKEEVHFILNYIIPRFKLENKIVGEILNVIKNRDLTADEIETIFKEEKEKHFQRSIQDQKTKEKLWSTLTQERVATMGRLSELHLVNWNIDKQQKSVYSYPYSKK